MSVIESFFFLFESDASPLKKGIDDAKNKADGLVNKMGQVDKAASTAGVAFRNLAAQVGGAILAGLSVAAFSRAIFQTAELNDKLNDLSERIGINTEDLSAWGDAVTLNGGSAEGFNSTVETMASNLAMMATRGTSRVTPFFKQLGIAMVDANGKARDVMDVLPEIADAFGKMGKQESLGMGRRMGLDQGTIQLLQQGRREVEAVIAKQKELGVTTKEDAEIAGKYKDQLDMTAHAFRSLYTVVGTSILPALTWVMEKFQNMALWMRKHSDFIVGVMIAIGAAVAVFVIPPLLSAAAAAFMAFLPFIALGALVAALGLAFALAYDDIMNFIDGNDSLIGELVKKWPWIADMARGIAAELKFLWDVAIALLGFLVDLFVDPLNAWDNFKNAVQTGLENLLNSFPELKEAANMIGDAFTAMGDTVAGVWNFITGIIKAVIADIMAGVDKVMGAANSVKSFLGFGDSEIKHSVDIGNSQISSMASSPLASQTSNSISSNRTSNKTTSVQTGPITVHTQATDAEGVAGALGSSLGNHIRQANSQFDDGVLA